MAKRKTKDMTEAMELIRQRVDLRTSWGQDAWATIEGYVERNDTSKISLLKGLAIEFPERGLIEVLNVDPVDYQRNVKAKCVCGQGLSREAYRMRIRGVSRKGGVESQIDGKIRDRVKVSRISRSSKVEFLLGKDCFAHFPDLLADFGYDDMQKTVREAKKKKQEKLEEIVQEADPELEKALRRKKIDPEQYKALSELMKESEVFTDKSVLFGTDPGKKNSFANWFREGIKKGSIDNKEIISSYHKLENAAHLVSTEELAALTTYACEYRLFETRAVIGGIRDDLLYLAEQGEVNIDKRFVRPRTRFRKRRAEKATIRDKLEQSHMTFLEALGIKLQFPDIEQTRVEYNREVTDKYGVGNTWYHLLKEIFPDFFENVKQGLAEDYSEFGEITNEHDLRKSEYLACKDFLKRSKMGRGTDRENYLRMFSIKKFRKVAPIVVEAGRKVRYARRKFEETGDEELKQSIIREKYILREDLEERFEELTGIEEEPDKVIDMIVNSGFVKSRSFLRFQRDHGQAIGEMYANGLLAKRYFKKAEKSKECVLKRQYDNLRFKVKEADEKTKEKLEQIAEWVNLPFVEYQGPVSADRMRSVKYVSREGVATINKLYSDIEKLFREARLEESDPRRFKRNKTELESMGRVLYLDQGEHAALASETIYDARSMKREAYPSYLYRGKKREYDVSVYDVKGIEDAVKNIRAGIKANKIFLKKLEALSKSNLRDLGSDKYCSLQKLRQGNFDNVVVSRALKRNVEELYEKIQDL